MMQLSMFGMTHGPNAPDGEQVLEYQLSSGIASTQYTIDMEPVYDPVTEEERWYDEVTDGFYETERGKRWLALSSYQDYSMRTIPVQPVDGTELLMHFYNGEAQITEGRDITEKEYAEGAKVCLIPEKPGDAAREENRGYTGFAPLLCRLFPAGGGCLSCWARAATPQ